MTLLYADVANVDWGPEEWTAQAEQNLLNFLGGVKAAGLAGVVHKVSQGAGFKDVYWQACRQWCETNDMSWLGYHYVTGDDADAQAANFVGNNGGPNAMLDFEQGSGNMGNFWTVVNAFNTAGVNISLAYIPNWYLNSPAGGYGDLSQLAPNQIALVSSAYPGGGGAPWDIYNSVGGDIGEGWNPYNGATPTVWQFTDQASVAGFRVDVNAYKGDNLDALFTS
jgi:hypothetical protein